MRSCHSAMSNGMSFASYPAPLENQSDYKQTATVIFLLSKIEKLKFGFGKYVSKREVLCLYKDNPLLKDEHVLSGFWFFPHFYHFINNKMMHFYKGFFARS